MAEIVNLRRTRKRRRRAEKDAVAATNRLRYGSSGAERQKSALGRLLDEKRLDAHRLEPDGEKR
jgi:hypothetical protein